MVNEHDAYGTDIGAYVLGALSVGETADFERHLAGCERCREDLVRLRVAADALPRSVEPLEPPPALKRSLMQAIEQEIAAEGGASQRPRGLRLRRALPWRSLEIVPRARLGWAAAAALLAVAAAVGLGASQIGSSGGGGHVVAAAVDRARLGPASARLTIASGRSGALLHVSGMPQPPRGQIYEVWVKRGNAVSPVSLFGVRSNGDGAAAIPGPLRGASAVLVTREPLPGTDVPSETPVISAHV